MIDVTRLLDLPALACLSVDAGELALITVSHEHADRVVVERRRMGGSIDVHELLSLVGLYGIAEAPRVEVSAVPVPELPAPVEDAPTPTTRRTTRNAAPGSFPCPDCGRHFKNPHARVVHQGMRHGLPEPTPVPEPAPAAPDPTPIATKPERFVCPQCGKEFKSQFGYTTHVEVAHAIPTATAPSDHSDTCGACGEPLLGHLRCSDCAGLLGPEHDAGEPEGETDSGPLCGVCVGYHFVIKELKIA